MILMKDIIADDDPRIRQVSEEVTLPLSEEDEQLAQEMLAYLKNSQDDEIAEEYDLRPGVGLAAVQLGILKRMCAIYIPEQNEDGEITKVNEWVLVNPKIVSHTQKQAYIRNGEGCLSVPEDKKGYVPRYAKITVQAYDALTKKEVRIVARGFTAICIQHEMDHFDGILYYDHFNKENPLTPVPNAMIID